MDQQCTLGPPPPKVYIPTVGVSAAPVYLFVLFLFLFGSDAGTAKMVGCQRVRVTGVAPLALT